MKFRALKENRQVSLAIYDNYTGFNKLGGMQVMGKAEMVEPWTQEYIALLAFKKIPEQNLRKLSHPLYLIKITPERIDLLSSEFKKMGYPPRQAMVF